jgi:hypothetical protein
VSISYLWNRLHRSDNALLEYGFFQQVSFHCIRYAVMPSIVRHVCQFLADLLCWYHSHERQDGLLQLCMVPAQLRLSLHTSDGPR